MKYAVLLSLLLGLFLAGCTAPQEWVREYPGYLPDAEEGRIVVLSVRDAETGAPVAGARIRQHIELWPTKDAR
jgi:hypothetical protein